MARPSKPLITRKAAVEAALKIIEESGLDGFSMRRLGEALNVNPMSLYHHFENKEAILVAICEHVFYEQQVPDGPATDIAELVLTNAKLYYRALCRHRNLLPILLRRHPMKIGADRSILVTRLLEESGVPAPVFVVLQQAMTKLALGSASYFHATQSDDLSAEWREDHRELEHVLEHPALTHEELFETSASATIRAILERFDLDVKEE